MVTAKRPNNFFVRTTSHFFVSGSVQGGEIILPPCLTIHLPVGVAFPSLPIPNTRTVLTPSSLLIDRIVEKRSARSECFWKASESAWPWSSLL